MTQDQNLPLALLRAQSTFWLRTGELMQENRARWLALAEREQHDDATEVHTEADESAPAADWQTLAALPMNAQWRVLKQAVAMAQGLTLTAIQNQTAFSAGMQQALAQWQTETAQALSDSRNAMPISGAMKDLLRGVAALPADKPTKKAKA